MSVIKMKHLKKHWPDHLSEVLLPHHIADLRKSGLSDETILAARIYSVSSKEAKILLNRKQEVGAGYVIPYPSGKGKFSSYFNLKLDVPIVDSNGKTHKYLKPKGSKNKLYIPVSVWPVLRDVSKLLIFVEGEKKVLSATEREFSAIAFSGVWNWISDHNPLEEFENIKLCGRRVFIAFDADKLKKHNVLLAEKRLAEFLISTGAKVHILNFSTSGDDA